MFGEGISGKADLTEYKYGEQLVVKIALTLDGNPEKLSPWKERWRQLAQG